MRHPDSRYLGIGEVVLAEFIGFGTHDGSEEQGTPAWRSKAVTVRLLCIMNASLPECQGIDVFK